jgi:hypothetical protein
LLRCALCLLLRLGLLLCCELCLALALCRGSLLLLPLPLILRPLSRCLRRGLPLLLLESGRALCLFGCSSGCSCLRCGRFFCPTLLLGTLSFLASGPTLPVALFDLWADSLYMIRHKHGATIVIRFRGGCLGHRGCRGNLGHRVGKHRHVSSSSGGRHYSGSPGRLVVCDKACAPRVAVRSLAERGLLVPSDSDLTRG